MDPIEKFVAEQSRAGSWPGGSWIVEAQGRTVSEGAAGFASLEPSREPASPETIYDLASLTKPLATAPLLALLETEGKIDLAAPAASWFPDLSCARGGRPTLLDLAAHRSGLPAWFPLYAFAGTVSEVLNTLVRLQPEAPSGTKVVYSDLGYILLGVVLERATGRGLDELFSQRIAGPLGLETIGFRPAPALRPRVAPTERGNAHERRMCAERGIAPAPGKLRERLIHGEVHDGNAHALGGVAGHAGLFGTASDVALLAREFLEAGTGIFGPAAIAEFRQNLTPGLEEGRTLGWKRAVAGAREAVDVLPEEAFGHTGFTGVSVWIDPLAGASYVLLTNRVHPEVKPTDMAGLRRRFHEIARSLM